MRSSATYKLQSTTTYVIRTCKQVATTKMEIFTNYNDYDQRKHSTVSTDTNMADY